MPAVSKQRSVHLNELEKGLKNLKSSKMRKTKEFDTMYDIIEQHHRNLKLGYLTGMPSDRRKQAEQDCKFYFILIKMLGELDNASDFEKQAGLAQVFNWFEENKEVLHTGPRFGKARKRSATARSESLLGESFGDQSALLSSQGSISSRLTALQRGRLSTASQISSALQKRRASTFRTSASEESARRTPPSPAPSPNGSEVSAAAEYYFQQYGGGHIEDVELTEKSEDSCSEETGCCPSPIQSITTRPRSAPTPTKDHRPLGPTPDTAMRGRRTPTACSEPEVLLPRRKPLPLPHVFNPLSKALEATAEIPRSTPDGGGNLQLSSKEGTPCDPLPIPKPEDNNEKDNRVKIIPEGMVYETPGGGSVYQDPAGGVISLRMTHLQKWGSYQQNQNMGQDFLAKMQYVGRSGVAGSVRYAAHENSLMAEDMTQEVIANYALLDDIAKKQQGRSPPTGDSKRLLEKPLEEFYQSTEPYFPVQRPKYSYLRGKSAPPAGKLQRHGSDKENIHNVGSALSNDSGFGSRCESNVKLDTLVNMIDTITDEITFHKEKVAPDPMPGFRQPAMLVEQGTRPQTAPPGARTRPLSADDSSRDARSESHMYSQVMPERELLLQRTNSDISAPSRVPTTLELIDWRGKVTPESARTRWNQGFGSHSYVKKSGRPRSSLRSGSSNSVTSSRKALTSASTIESRLNPEMIAAENKRPAVAASHTTTEVDSGVMSSLLTTTKFNGGKVRKRPEMMEDEELPDYFFIDDMGYYQREHSAKSQSKEEPREYLTICNSIPGLQETKAAKLQRKQESTRRQHIGTDSHVKEKSKQDTAESRAPVVSDTSDFLQEVKRLIADGALEEEETKSEGHPNTARTPEGQQRDPNQSGASQTVKKQLTFVLADGTEVRQGDEDWEQYEVQALDELGDEDQEDVLNVSGDFGLNQDEAQIMNLDVEFFMKSIDRSTGVPAPTSAKLAKSYKQRVFQHSFPRQQTQLAEDETANKQQDIDELTVEGRGTKTKILRKHKASDATKNRPKTSRRSAGTSPTRAKSANPLRVLQKQSEMLKNSPVEPYRTAPSIPTPWGELGTRTPRAQTATSRNSVYMAEMEAQSRKMRSPKHYMEKFSDLRSSEADTDRGGVLRIPPASDMPDAERALSQSLRVFRMTHEDGTPITISTERPKSHRRKPETKRDHECSDTTCAACLQEDQGNQQTTVGEFAGQRLLEMGRPIPDYLPAADPVEIAAAVERQKEVQAAVDIQRIFRGYVIRNQYKYLLREERQKREDKQKAAIEIQRHMRGHLARKRAIHKRKPRQLTLDWAKKYKELLKERERRRQMKCQEITERNARKKAEADAKLAIIGPHVEVYAPFHPKKFGPDRALLNRAATIISKNVRGWLVRLKMERLKRKARYYSNSWDKFMTSYNELLRRVQLRAGVDKPQAPFDFKDINEYMDDRKRYECVFDRRSFAGEMDNEEVGEYFKECELYPGKSEIEDAVASVFRGQASKKDRGFYKQEIIEITFQIYPPRGACLPCTRKSTWLNPIIDGEEAIKLKGTEGVEPTDFKTCWKLVSGTAKDRKAEISKQAKLVEEEEESKREEESQSVLKPEKNTEELSIKIEENAIKEEEQEDEVAATEEETPAEPEQEEQEVDHPPSLVEETREEEQKQPEKQEEKLEEIEKSFMEKKLQIIEDDAPGWIPQSADIPKTAESKKVSVKKLMKITEDECQETE